MILVKWPRGSARHKVNLLWARGLGSASRVPTFVTTDWLQANHEKDEVRNRKDETGPVQHAITRCASCTRPGRAVRTLKSPASPPPGASTASPAATPRAPIGTPSRPPPSSSGSLLALQRRQRKGRLEICPVPGRECGQPRRRLRQLPLPALPRHGAPRLVPLPGPPPPCRSGVFRGGGQRFCRSSVTSG